MSTNAESEVQGGRCLGLKTLAGSIESWGVVESVGTVAGVQSWRQIIPNFRRCDKEATSA